MLILIGVYCFISSCCFFFCSDEIKVNCDEIIFIFFQFFYCDFVIVCVISLIKYVWNVVQGKNDKISYKCYKYYIILIFFIFLNDLM